MSIAFVFIAAVITPLLWKVLYVILALAAIACVLWGVEYVFTVKIPNPIRLFMAIICLILAAIYLLGGM